MTFIVLAITFLLGLIIGLYCGNYQKEINELEEFKKRHNL